MHRHIKNTAKKVHLHINRHALFWVVFLFTSMMIALQLLYPFDRALPFARFGSELVGYQRYDDLAVRANKYFTESRAQIYVDDKRHEDFVLGDVGGSPDIDSTAKQLVDYPLWQRIIPLSFLFLHPSVNTISVKFEPTRLEKFSDDLSKKLSVQPHDAGLKIKDGKLSATDDVPGTIVTKDAIKTALTSQNFGLVFTTVNVPYKVQDAQKPSSYFAEVRAAAESTIALPIVIRVDNDEIRPLPTEVASWLQIGEDSGGKAALTINNDAVKAYLQTIQSKYLVPAGQTQVSRVDGREVSRVEGVVGKTIDIDSIQSRLSEQLLARSAEPIIAIYVPVYPTVVINQKYSSTQAGLQAYVTDQSVMRNVRISVQQIGGNGWTVGARELETTVSASTYKLFVALMLFDKMDKGELSWDTPILDTSTRGCFERMIVASTNACAEEWIRQFGRVAINDFIYSKGFSHGTNFNNPIANHTTAWDLARYFKGLHEGWLMSSEHRQYLLDALKRHHYTKGIPSGSAGSAHNKVGFLWDYSNDSAIVYHPRGTYSIAIMTKGLSFYAIASITREIEAIMYP